MITMYDADNAANIPPDALVAAGYVDGSKSFDPICAKVPHATHMSISLDAGRDADCLDVEPHAASADEVPGWLSNHRRNRVPLPVIYADLSHMKLVLDVLRQHGIARSSVRLWSAHYPDSPDNLKALGEKHPAQLAEVNRNAVHICGPRSGGGCGQIDVAMDGTQFTCRANGANLDQSLLHDNFFGTPSPPPTPFVSDGSKSLNDLGTQFHNAVSTMLRLTAENSPGAVFRQGMAAYINEVFAADKEKVQKGVIVFHSDGNVVKDFTCSGNQTLQGLALSFGCQPSAIVRLTAENSPGAVFSGAMADYLNDVFGRSTTHVPSGVHLFHQK